ncbi:MAG: hypothetical protein FJ029_11950 [Actinobacteria bacterium]|nr:hypothetical protein [Actinomycetota bacterium]
MRASSGPLAHRDGSQAVVALPNAAKRALAGVTGWLEGVTRGVRLASSYGSSGVFVGLTLVVAALPAFLVDPMAARAGGWFYRLDGVRQRRLRENLRVVLGPESDSREIEAAARDVYASYGRYLLEYFTMGWPDIWRRGRRVAMDTTRVAEALRKGRGVIIVSAHAANFEVAARELRRRFGPVHSAGEVMRPLWIGRVIAGIRRRAGFRVYDERNAARPLLRALAQNQVVGLAADRIVYGNGVEAVLCGRRTQVTKGPVLLALMSGAALLPAYVRRLPRGRIQVVFGEEVPLHDLGRSAPDVATGVQRMADAVSTAIRFGCRSWYGLHPIWGTLPHG